MAVELKTAVAHPNMIRRPPTKDLNDTVSPTREPTLLSSVRNAA